MPRLTIEIGYTLGSPAKYNWLANKLPPVLRNQFQLDVAVRIMPQPLVPFSKPPFYDSDLYQITHKVIDSSPIRRAVEANGEWYLHLFITSLHRNNFLGVMYDLNFDPRQRQGCAVFESEIFELAQRNVGNAQRIVLRTTLHEIGHCLNLIHHNDRTLMAQTGSLMNDPHWIQNIRWNYAPSDVQFVTQRPDDSRPGGYTTNTGGGDDSTFDISKQKLSITFRDFNRPATYKFRAGEPVSLIVKLTNRTTRKIFLPLPLHINSENIRIWIKSPDGRVTHIIKSIRGCGTIAKKITLDKGHYCLLPVNLYSDRAGYLFGVPGQYGVKVGIRNLDGTWCVSHFCKIKITKGKSVMKHSKRVMQFVELGGGETKIARKKYLSIAQSNKHELSRALYWDLSYQEKDDLFNSTLTQAVQKKKARILAQLYRALLPLENSPIRRGKILLNLEKIKSILHNRPAGVNPHQQKDINAYKLFSQHLVKNG